MNHFALLNFPPAFDLNMQALESAYFAAQRQYHPDRFAGKPPAERAAALERSADINRAYEALKNPLPRAQYLLQLQGIAVGTEADSVKPSPGLLTETMKWREQIAEAKNAEELDKLDEALNKILIRSIKIISNAHLYTQWDAMAQETLRLGYILKAQDAIKQRQKTL